MSEGFRIGVGRGHRIGLRNREYAVWCDERDEFWFASLFGVRSSPGGRQLDPGEAVQVINTGLRRAISKQSDLSLDEAQRILAKLVQFRQEAIQLLGSDDVLVALWD